MIKREYRDVLRALAQIVAFVHNYSMYSLDSNEKGVFFEVYTSLMNLSNFSGEPKPADHLAEFKNIMDEAHVDYTNVHWENPPEGEHGE